MKTLPANYNRSELFKSIILGLISGIFVLIVLNSLEIESELFAYLAAHQPIIFGFICLSCVAWVYFIHYLGSSRPVVIQFGKFIAVGQSNAAIDIGILNLLIILTDIDSGVYYSLFKGISFMFALVNSFLWNKFWSFDSKEKDGVGKQFVMFVFVALIGLIINIVVASLVVNYIGPQWGITTRLWANIGVLSSAVFTLIWDFYGYKMFVFKK